ncbi:MAG: tetratricopeptide repeat protein [Candidatus Goldiibacteriota bacterium]
MKFNFPKVIVFMFAVILLMSSFAFASPAKARQYLLQGNKLLQAKKYNNAIRYYNASIKQQPTANAYYYLGVAYQMSGKKAEALRSFQRALKLNPNHTNAKKMAARLQGASGGGSSKAKQYLAMGHKLFKQNKLSQAIRYYNASAKLQPTYQAYQFMGTAYYKMGDKANAIKAYERSLQINPNNPGVKNVLNKLKGQTKTAGDPRLSEQMGVHPLLLAGLFAGAIAVLFLF